MEELVTGMAFLERSPGTKLRIGISFCSVILAGQVPSSTRVKSAVVRSGRAFQFDGKRTKGTEPRYEITMGKDPRPERNNAVFGAGKVCCGRCGWEGAFCIL